jgi:Zn-dependent protease
VHFGAETLALGAIWYIVFLLSTTCHEGAHALAAKLGGDPTAFHRGQVTLNPLPHIRQEPFGTVLVPILSYLYSGWMIGWASAPYDPLWQAQHPRRAAWMAMAGPGANFALMLLAAVAIRIGVALGHFRAPEAASITRVTEATDPATMGFVATFLSILFLLNLILGTFNLLPVPPLDGNTSITLLMPKRAALRFLDWTRNQPFGFLGLLLAWLVYGKIFQYLFPLALRLLYPGITYG